MKLQKANIATNILLLVLYAVLAACAAAVSVITNNLFVKFAAVTTVFFAAANIFVYFFYLKHFRGMDANLTLPVSITALSPTDMILRPDKRVITVPMTDIRFEFTLSDNTLDDKYIVNTDFYKADDGATVSHLILNVGRHGDFATNHCMLRVKPVYGFGDFIYPINCRQKVTVIPKYSDGKYETTHINYGDTDGSSRKSMQSSTDLFDNRKYYPGDDPRRINWKIFSHIGELQIRQAEHTSTNYGNQNIVFMPLTDDLEEYEKITSVFVGICRNLLGSDIRLNIYSPLQTKPINIRQNNAAVLDNIINGSYKNFDNCDIPTEYLLVIGSVTQLSRCLSAHKLTDSVLIAADAASLDRMSAPIVFIRRHDMLIKDLAAENKLRRYKQTKRDAVLRLQQLAGGNKLIFY